MKPFKCRICGKEDNPSDFIKQTKSEMEHYQMCFNCNFWREMLEKDAQRLPHTYCIIDGTHYVIEPEDSKSFFRGFDGARFQIEFNDGTKVITTNLWCQGDIPEKWLDKFSNNARFENNLKWT